MVDLSVTQGSLRFPNGLARIDNYLHKDVYVVRDNVICYKEWNVSV